MAENLASNREFVVGYDSHNYNGERNTYAPIEGVTYVKMRRIPFEYTPGPEHFGLHRVFAPLAPNPKVDLVHLWNRVSVGRTPWGVSFEDTLPYLNPRLHARAISLQRKLLFSDQCRFIIGMSDYAVRQFRSTLSDSEWLQIANKVHQIYPHHPKPIRNSTYPGLEEQDSLRLIFVGGDFFRKGGEPALRAVEEVGDELDLQLTVISRVEGNDYSGTPPADVDVVDVRRRLADNPRVDWMPHLPHNEVMASIEHHHVGLLPTLSDTFGYSVLEFMGLGVPSIVSNVQALPEFTGPETGWRLDVATDDRGVWLGRNPDMEHRRTHYFETVGHTTSQLIEVLRAVRADPDVLRVKSLSASARFDEQFDPHARHESILSIYANAAS